MAGYAGNDLLGLDVSSASSDPPISPLAVSSSAKSMTASNCCNVPRDSFSDLAGLMKAKKPYTSPTPRASLSNASNGMYLVSRKLSASSNFSPTAKPFISSATAWLEEQDQMLSTPIPRILGHRQTNFDRLEELTRSINDFQIDDEPDCRPGTPSPPSPQRQLLVLGLPSPPRSGPIETPIPIESIQPRAPTYKRTSVPAVRSAKDALSSINELTSPSTQKRRVHEDRLETLECDHWTLHNEEHDIDAQLGKLRYQNEANRDQKASMGRALAQKDVEIREQQLEIDNLRKKIVELDTEIHRCGKLVGDAEWLRVTIKDDTAAHVRSLEERNAAVQRLEDTVERLTRERDAATQVHAHAGDHVTHARKLVDTLSKRERLVTDLRQMLLEEQMRATDLEEQVESFREKADQDNLDSLKDLLREKSSQCDRFRNQLKDAERKLQLVQSRLNAVLGGGEALRGGAHLVIPHEHSKLPKNVISCSECYAKNITCDDGARCRNCVDGLIKCSRWRCSLKQKLNECPDTPCQLPHDAQGWLVTVDPRPTW